MKTISAILLSCILLFGSCAADPVVEGAKKVTYRVSGTEYNVMIRYPNGAKELVYNQTEVLKRYAHADVGDPIYVLAYGSTDLVVTIVVDGVVDTIRRASTTGGSLVLLDTYISEN